MTVTSDNMPFNSESRRFAAELDFQWLFTSPGNPQSNGIVERHIQIIKNVLKKAEETRTDACTVKPEKYSNFRNQCEDFRRACKEPTIPVPVA